MKKIIIKIGSSSLINEHKKLCRAQMVEFIRQITHLRNEGIQIVLVTSGAIATAQSKLAFIADPQCLPSKQMLASIGQVQLMHAWSELFTIYECTIGQILLTRDDISDPKRAQNAKNTFHSLLEHQIIPVVNENDSIATEEICFGDNDTLSALVAEMIEADHLILLTDQKGLYTADPRFHKEAKLIQSIETIDDLIANCATDSVHSTSVGTGGMMTKVEAAKLATQKGIAVTIASAKEPNVLLEIVAGKKIGTTFEV